MDIVIVGLAFVFGLVAGFVFGYQYACTEQSKKK
jgi:hypothetical protein